MLLWRGQAQGMELEREMGRPPDWGAPPEMHPGSEGNGVAPEKRASAAHSTEACEKVL